VFLALVPMSSSGQNLIVNGRFMTDLSGWTAVTDEGSAVWDGAGADEAGSAAMHSTAADTGVFKGYLTQCVPVAGGSSYVLSHRVRFSASETTSGWAETALYWTPNIDCSGYISGNGVLTSKASPGVFISDSSTVTAPLNARAAYVRVGIDKLDAGGIMSVSVDDISFVPASAASETLAGYLTVAASTPGAFGSHFKTSVQLFNPNTIPIAGHLVYHPTGVPAGSSDPTIGFSLGPLQTYSWDDIVAALGQSGVGSL